MIPPEGTVYDDDFKPLEVEKNKITGPVVLVINTPSTWELEITVTNNLAPVEVEEELEEKIEDPTEDMVFYSTRAGENTRDFSTVVCPNTITDVVVKDILRCEFVLMEHSLSQGHMTIVKGENGVTELTWYVGNLNPQHQATLTMLVGTAGDGISRGGSYVLNPGATASGFHHSTKEILTDGPTRSILVSVTDGDLRLPPVAEAGVDQMNFEDNPIYLDGSGSYDPDGTVIKYMWYAGDQRLGSARTALIYLPVGVYEVTLTVEDNHGLRATDTLTVTVFQNGAKVPGGIMTGIVRDATTRRGFDPYIIVSNDDFAISTWTDMGGNYRIIGLPAGDYHVYCETPGYRDFHGSVTIEENAEVDYTIDMFRR